MAAEQRVKLIFEITGSKRIKWRSAGLRKRCLQSFDLGSLLWGEVEFPKFVAGVSHTFQQIAKLAAGSFRRRRGIVQLMRQARRQLTQSRQAITLLFETRGLADSVRHKADQTGRQLRRFLDEFGEERRWKAQQVSVRHRPPTQRKVFHAGERKNSSD